jgi:pimeloyl-ACP methyl ester carboxylesterase
MADAVFSATPVILATAEFATLATADAQSNSTHPSHIPPVAPGTNASFASVKQINARLLNVGYAEAGPADGPAVILLHGWPYDIHSFADVTPLLASAGYRVIVPHLRGYGTMRFLSSETMRNARQSAVALDIIALMDALKIQTATVGGFDWGARTADVMATLWPERCKAIVSVSGYLISSPAGNQAPPVNPNRDLAGSQIGARLLVGEARDHKGKNFPFARREKVVVPLQLGEFRSLLPCDSILINGGVNRL